VRVQLNLPCTRPIITLPTLGKTIGLAQSAFIYNILLTHEVINKFRIMKEKRLGWTQIRYEKAYNQIEWNFLLLTQN